MVMYGGHIMAPTHEKPLVDTSWNYTTFTQKLINWVNLKGLYYHAKFQRFHLNNLWEKANMKVPLDKSVSIVNFQCKPIYTVLC